MLRYQSETALEHGAQMNDARDVVQYFRPFRNKHIQLEDFANFLF